MSAGVAMREPFLCLQSGETFKAVSASLVGYNNVFVVSEEADSLSALHTQTPTDGMYECMATSADMQRGILMGKWEEGWGGESQLRLQYYGSHFLNPCVILSGQN